MADPRVYPTYYDTYSRTKKPFMKKQAADTMSIGPDMSATPGYVDPNLPISQQYLKGPLKRKAFVTAPTKKQKDAIRHLSLGPPKKKEPRYTDSLFPTLPTTPGINPYFDYEKLDWRTSLDRFGKEFLDSKEGGSGFTLKTPEQGANYKTVNWEDAGFTSPTEGTSTGEEEVYFNPTTRQVVRAPYEGFIAPEGWTSLNNIKPISPDVPEDFVRGDEPSRYTTVREPYTYEGTDYDGDMEYTVTKTGYRNVQRENPEWTTWSQTPDPVREQYEKDLAEFDRLEKIYEERQEQIDEFEDYEPDFTLKYDPTQAEQPGNLFDQAARLFENFNVPMSIDPISGKLIINNKVMNSIQDLRNEHRKLIGQTGVGTFDVPVGMDPATFYRNMGIFRGTGATYYNNLRGTLNPYGDVWEDTIDPTQDVLPQITQQIIRQQEQEQIEDDGDMWGGEDPEGEPTGGTVSMGGHAAGDPADFGGGGGGGGAPGSSPSDTGDAEGGPF